MKKKFHGEPHGTLTLVICYVGVLSALLVSLQRPVWCKVQVCRQLA